MVRNFFASGLAKERIGRDTGYLASRVTRFRLKTGVRGKLEKTDQPIIEIQ